MFWNAVRPLEVLSRSHAKLTSHISIPDQYHYLIINALIIAYPLAQSYEHRIRFLANWRAIFTSIAVVGAIFLMWDELFTSLQVWGFNERYLSGVYIGRLPMEEYGFFLTAPFACLFVHEVLRYYIPKDVLNPYRLGITWFFLVTCIVLAVFFYPRIYSTSVFVFGAILLSAQLFLFKSEWLGRFFLSYLVCMIPFMVMNSWLTGSFTEEPIVWYSDFENSGLRIGTIPIEDAFYQLAYFMLIVGIYERNKLRRYE